MKKITFKETLLFALSCMMLLTQSAFSGNLYWGTAGTWNSGTPWFSDVARTTSTAWANGNVARFDLVATITGPSSNVTIAGITANDNVTFTAGAGVFNTGNVPVSFNVASGKLLDFGTQGLITTAGTTHGIIKDGAGALAITGNGYLGGFTLNSGTVTAKGVNAFGLGTLTINGGTIGATAGNTYAATGINIGADFIIGGATSGSGSATAAFAFLATAPVTLGSANRTITLGGTGMVTFQGNLSGDAGVGLTLSSTLASGTSPFRLTGDNSGYKGITTINNFVVLRLGSANALGTTDAGTVVNAGGTLDIYGTNYTSAEPVTLTGGSSTAAIANNTTPDATFNGPITLNNYAYVNGASAKLNLTNTIGGTGTLYLAGVQGGSVSGAISVDGGLSLSNGTWTISGANSYTGATTINAAKILILGAAGTIPDGSGLALAGTLKTGATVGFSETIGTLTITDNATIALGTGVHTLTFADSHTVTWTTAKTLTITGWSFNTTTGATEGRIFVGATSAGLTSTQLAQINFTGFGTGAQILSTGEIIPASITAAPTLTAAVAATVDGAFDVTFTDNATWRGAITSITVGGTTLDPLAYNKTVANKITFTPSASSLLQSAGSKSIVIVAPNYYNGSLSQTIGVGVPTSNSTATIDASLAISTSRTITCTAKDQYNNLVSGYIFKYDLTVTNSDATTAESYTIDGTAHTTTASDINVTTTTNASGVATFTAAVPATVDGGDGLSIQVQLANGSTNIGSAFAFSMLTQTISSFNSISNKTYGDATFEVSATGGGSGNSIIFSSSNSNVATVAGTTVTIVGAGDCTIYANQAGNATYAAAAQLGQSFTVNKASQTITFGALPTGKTIGEADFAPGATSGTSGVNAISYTTSNSAVATISGIGEIHIVGAGTCTIYANQASSTNYNAATQASQSLTIAARPVLIMGSNATEANLTNDVADISVPAGADLTIGADRSVHNITIERGGKVTLNDGYSLTVNNINLNSDASGTGTFVDKNATIAHGLTVNGTTTVQQYVTSTAKGVTGRNWYISSPVSAALSSTITTATTNDLVSYTESTGQWTNAGTTMDVMKGYIAVSPAQNTTLVFNGGTLNTGAQSVSNLSYTGATKKGFNLIGNPYPSYLDWDGATLSNVLKSVWYRSKRTGVYLFQTYNTDGGVETATNGATNLIPPMQAFWVRATSATNSVSFDNSMRSHQDQTVATNRLKSPSKSNTVQQVLRLAVSNGVNSDETVVYSNSNALNGIDSYDSPKMTNNNAAIPELYTLVDGEQMVINGLNTIPYDTELPLGFTTGQTNSFTIKASLISNFDAGTQIMLKDYQDSNNPVITELSDGSSYSFTSDATNNNTSRFTLMFKAPSTTTGMNPESNSNLWISSHNGQVVLNGAANGATLEVFNTLGQKVISKNITESTVQLKNNLAAGAYLVKVSNAGKTITRKIIID